MGDIRVFVADDHPSLREGLARLIDATEGMTCVGHTEDGFEVVRLAKADAWDVLILDLSGLGDAGGVEILDQLRREVPKLPVIVYSMYPESQYGVRMLQAGARAYLSKSLPTATLREAIRRVAAGGRYITPGIAERLLEPTRASMEQLSTRELQVLQLLVDGLSMKRIGSSLHISISTVSTHIGNAREKLGVSSNAELVRLAIREGLCT